MTQYKTLQAAAQDEFTEKRSRFIGYARPVTSEQEALDFIAEIKSKHWDAKHNVYAYCLLLGVIQKSGLTDCAVVVTRYFGGILLGGGGLVRAYSHGASIGIAAAGIVTMRMCLICRLSCDYNQYGRLAALIPECGGSVSETSFGECVEISFIMTREDLARFEPKLADATGGSVRADIAGEQFFAVNED